MNKILITSMLALTLTGLGAEIKLYSDRYFSKDLSYAKAKEQNVILLTLMAPNHRQYKALSDKLQSNILDNEEFKTFLGDRKVTVVNENYLDKDNKRWTARVVWRSGNLVGLVLLDLNGNVLNKLTVHEVMKKKMEPSDIIKIYEEFLPEKTEKKSEPKVKIKI